MSERYPLLAAMRAKRQRIEDEISEPHRKAALHSAMIANQEREARAGLERIMASKMAPRIMDVVSEEMGRGIYRALHDAIAKQKSFTGTTKLELPTMMLMQGDPESIVGRVVDWWKRTTAPKISFRAYRGEAEMKQRATRLTVSIPDMHYSHLVADDL